MTLKRAVEAFAGIMVLLSVALTRRNARSGGKLTGEISCGG
jgi:hypothetical protein